MINVIYGHTSYLDVLRIQSDYISKYGECILFINKSNIYMDDIIIKYDKVIFYDDSFEYANRLISCIEQLECKYFTFIHDIDIILDMNMDIINKFYDLMQSKNIDRIDLKNSNNLKSNKIINFNNNSIEDWNLIDVNQLNDSDMYIVKQIDPYDYIYNVNPSIWNRETFLGMLKTFPYKNYRNIEERDVQHYCSMLEMYKLHTKTPLKCGYFECLNIFIYLHITHSGNLLLLNNNYQTEFGQSYYDVAQDYVKIVDKYNLKTSNKWV